MKRIEATKPGPVLEATPGFLYQLDEDTGVNIWSGTLSPNNGYHPRLRDEFVRKAMAADDMLALAKLIVSETDEDEEGEMPHHPREALQILRKAARAAIAKATGGAQ